MQISAYVDGELPDSEADLLLRRMSQDAELRREAAEYLELGRAIRGEASVPGADRLRERIAAALDDKVLEKEVVAADEEDSLPLKPLIGIAVAASVALVALFALQLTPGVDTAAPADETVAVEDASYIVPPDGEVQLLDSNEDAVRLTADRDSEEIEIEDESEEDDADEAADDDAAEATTTP